MFEVVFPDAFGVFLIAFDRGGGGLANAVGFFGVFAFEGIDEVGLGADLASGVGEACGFVGGDDGIGAGIGV